MARIRVVASGAGVVLLTAGCSLLTNLDGLTSGAGDAPDATTTSEAGADAVADAVVDAVAVSESGADADADAGCTCTNLVSAYRFSDVNNLGHDFVGKNHMTTVTGTPKQSTVTPNGLPGNSIQLDGSTSVCIDSGYSFDATADHTLCWWSQPAVLGDNTDQFAQACTYDAWTANTGADYLWRINNCNSGTPANLQVPNTYAVGQWVQICQTYTRASLKRAVVVNGKTSNKVSVTDAVPIATSSSPWCIGAYGSGGFWTGLIYQPMWFDRVLSDKEIEQVSAGACCLH